VEVEVSAIAPEVVVEVPAKRQGVAEVGMGVADQELKRRELDFRVVNHLNMNFTDPSLLDHQEVLLRLKLSQFLPSIFQQRLMYLGLLNILTRSNSLYNNPLPRPLLLVSQVYSSPWIQA